MSTMPTGDPYGPVYNLLDAIAMKHMEMAQLVAGYKAMIEDLEERPDPENVKLARVPAGGALHGVEHLRPRGVAEGGGGAQAALPRGVAARQAPERAATTPG